MKREDEKRFKFLSLKMKKTPLNKKEREEFLEFLRLKEGERKIFLIRYIFLGDFPDNTASV